MTCEGPDEREVESMAAVLNKYLTFSLGDETYGMPILRVKEIIGLSEITKMPSMPMAVRGVINLRGTIIPIIDLRVKFGMSERAYDNRTCIIVVEPAERDAPRCGLVVDTVSEVMGIPSDFIEPPPRFGNSSENAYLTGLGKMRDKVILLLEIDRVLGGAEVESFGNLQAPA